MFGIAITCSLVTLLVLAASTIPPQVEATGLAELILRSDDIKLAGKPLQDSIFKDSSNTIEPIRGKLDEIFKKLDIEVVAPNKYLSKMMNTVSTKSRFMFLADREKYLETMKIDTSIRPMLLSYLGTHLAKESDISSWYANYRSHAHEKIVEGCDAFVKLRKGAEEKLDGGDLDALDKINATNKLAFVYLKFESNMNLFMIDNFLMLCSKLEPESIKDQLNGLKVKV